MRWLDWLPFGRVPEMSPEDLLRCLGESDPPLVVDVRTALEFRAGHIAAARHVPLPTLAAAIPSIAHSAPTAVVAVCKTAHRSIPAVRMLQQAGLTAVQLAGGMDRWRRCALPIARGDPT